MLAQGRRANGIVGPLTVEEEVWFLFCRMSSCMEAGFEQMSESARSMSVEGARVVGSLTACRHLAGQELLLLLLKFALSWLMVILDLPPVSALSSPRSSSTV